MHHFCFPRTFEIEIVSPRVSSVVTSGEKATTPVQRPLMTPERALLRLERTAPVVALSLPSGSRKKIAWPVVDLRAASLRPLSSSECAYRIQSSYDIPSIVNRLRESTQRGICEDVFLLEDQSRQISQ